MQLNPDFSDLFAELNSAEVRYLLVGGYAVGVHAEPRFTKDLDVWIDSTSDNAARAYAGRPQDLADIDALERRSE
jgi:hypothetical protein